MIKYFNSLIFSLVLSLAVWLPANAAENGGGQKTASPASGTALSANSAVSSQMRVLEQQEKTDLQNLSQQMADLKARHQQEATPLQQQLESSNSAFQSAIKQLHDQYDETRTRDDDELATLMDKIKPGYLALYNEKKSALAEVNSREGQAIQSLRQQEDAELQSIRERDDAQRKGLQQESAGQRQAINSKFETQVKALK